MHSIRTLCALPAALALLTSPALAEGLDLSLAEPPGFELSLTPVLFGAAGVTLASDRTLFAERGQPEAFDYPGLDSLGGGFGLRIQARFDGWHSVEIGVDGTLEGATADFRGQETNLGLSALHFPVMYYLHAREPTVIDVDYIWTIGIGAEYVLPSTPSLDTKANFITDAVAEPYTNIVLYAGREFRFLNSKTKALDYTLRFDLARLAMRTDWLIGDRALAEEHADGTLTVNGEIDVRFTFGIGVGFGLL